MTAARHRFVTDEPRIPFDARILHEDAGIVVVDKPHFLATTPRGMWYRESLLIRLREAYGDDAITPAHRLDRATAGVVVFVRDPALRGPFQMMFQERRVAKTYECLAPLAPVHPRRPAVASGTGGGDDGRGVACTVRPRPVGVTRPLGSPRAFPLERVSHITKLRGRIQAFEEPGEANARTVVDILPDQTVAAGEGRVPAARFGLRAYELHPLTGKTHQLRVHMNALGLPIAGDDIYPTLLDRPYDDFSSPLQLVARSLSFTDPRDGTPRRFESAVPLGWPA